MWAGQPLQNLPELTHSLSGPMGSAASHVRMIPIVTWWCMFRWGPFADDAENRQVA